jgi:hypothetical protein
MLDHRSINFRGISTGTSWDNLSEKNSILK